MLFRLLPGLIRRTQFKNSLTLVKMSSISTPHSTSQGVKRPATDSESSPPSKIRASEDGKDCPVIPDSKPVHKYNTYEEFKKAKKFERINEIAEKCDKSMVNLGKLMEDAPAHIKALAGEETKCTKVVVSKGNGNFTPIDPQPVESSITEADDGQFNVKKKRRMYGILMSYSGKGYLGMQVNPPHATIEGELLGALHKVNLLTAAECLKIQSVFFQRAARTDKGVSAARQIVNLMLPISDGEEDKYCEDMNTLLPPQIRIMDLIRVTKNFNAKNKCDFRTYSYLLPTFAFCPMEEVITEQYRITPEVLEKVKKLFHNYQGSHNFHNFTIRKAATEASAKRFIHDFEVGAPFERDGMEWMLLKVKGQSFMMHQIRKMVGLVISICRGIVPPSHMLETFSMKKIETPKAPGLGLVLEQPHFVIYNKRFGQDGIHKALDWADIEDKTEAFRQDFIDKDIIATEIREKSMIKYIKLLHLFSNGHDDETGKRIINPLGLAHETFIGERIFERVERVRDDYFQDVIADEKMDETVTDGGEKTVTDGAKTVTDGAKTVTDGAKTVTDGAKTVTDGAKTVTDGAKTVTDGAKTVTDGAKTVTDGAKTVTDGAKTVTDGAKAVTDGAKTVIDGESDSLCSEKIGANS